MPNEEKIVSQDEVFGEWLKHECNGRFKEKTPPDFLAYANKSNYDDMHDNKVRLDLLLQIRAYARDFIPAEYGVNDWYIKTLNKGDIEKLEVIHSGPWKDISKSFKAVDIATAIFNSEKFDSIKSIEYIKQSYKEIVSEKRRITAVGTSIEDAVIIDGVHRAVALLYYKLKTNVEPDDKEIYFGLTDKPYYKEFV